MASIPCPICKTPQTLDFGEPAHLMPAVVAGVPIDLSDLHMRHFRCQACQYWFVYPRIPTERLIDCYSKSVNRWHDLPDAPEKRNYANKKQLLEQFSPSRNVLDFGCYQGEFLQSLGPEWNLAGIEPSGSAAKIAKSRGVQIIGPTLDQIDISAHRGQFGAVVIFDVMEHLPDPVPDLSRLRQMLMPGGIMLVETGNSDSEDMQRFGKRHMYCGYPEHIGVFNKRSIAEAASQAGMKLVHFEETVHTVADPGTLHYRRHLLAYHLLRFLRSIKVPLPKRLREIADGPFRRIIHERVHFLAVLRLD